MKRPSEEILAKLKGDDEDYEEDSEGSGSDEDKKRAAGEEFAAAIKSGDGLRIAQAYEDMNAVCGEY